MCFCRVTGRPAHVAKLRSEFDTGKSEFVLIVSLAFLEFKERSALLYLKLMIELDADMIRSFLF